MPQILTEVLKKYVEDVHKIYGDKLRTIILYDSYARGLIGSPPIPINGLKHIDVLKLFNDDPETDAVVMIGEIGGSDEETAAEWVKDHMKKPVVGFIAGVTAPAGKRMG